MEKKKIAFSMKSNFAFNRLKVTFSQFEVYRKNLDVYPDNFNTHDDMEDLLDFWKPDLIVLDTKSVEFQRIENLLVINNIPIVLFDSDYDVVVERVNDFFELHEKLEEEQEKEEQNIKYIEDPSKVAEKVIIKDRIVEKEIVKTEYTALNNKMIVVASLWSGAGSTTFAINLARAIAERGLEVSYVEYPLSKPYMFDYLSIPLHEEELEEDAYYVDVSKEILQSGTRKNKRKVWKQDGVNWFVTDTRLEPINEFTYEQMLQYVYSIHSVVTIVDVSARLDDPNVQKFLHHADEVFVCIEPDPVKIDWLSTIKDKGKVIENQRTEQKIITFLNEVEEEENLHYHFINTKYSDVINKEEWLESLEKEPLTYFPVIPYDDLLACVWNSTFLYDDEDYHEQIEKSLKPVIVKILPRDFYNLPTAQKKRSFFNLFKMGEGK